MNYFVNLVVINGLDALGYFEFWMLEYVKSILCQRGKKSEKIQMDFYDMYPLNQVIKLICVCFIYLFRWDSAATEQTPCSHSRGQRPAQVREAGPATFRARPRALLWDSQEEHSEI